ncbi:hypothetical protein AK830_g5500 [Neonectria ditissima]|uniref:Uncharacterized protein n=1 Tax=Neonectria ditissima TaxID=78410 RepID=A0A0P7BLS7_9HYPO|nr:hypothetical protein AK830_g5500 [Neonectria ditissima]
MLHAAMLFLLILFAVAVPPTTCFNVFQRDAVDFTVHAGTLVGTGMIDFSSPLVRQSTEEVETRATDAPERSEITCESTAIGPGVTSLTTRVEDMPFNYTSPSEHIPVTPTPNPLPSNTSFGATETPSNTATMVSQGQSLRQLVWPSLLSLGLMSFYSFL